MDPHHPVVVFACGEPLRGDDGVAAVAVGLPLPFARDRARVRTVVGLTPDGLLGLAPGTRVVVVDAVVGVEEGRLVRVELDELETCAAALRHASSHQLPLSQVVGLAREMRPLAPGVFLGVGIRSVRPGAGLSPAVRDAVPRLRAAIGAEVERLSRGREVASSTMAVTAAGDGRGAP
jgi:hydrogenase maturation protease